MCIFFYHNQGNAIATLQIFFWKKLTTGISPFFQLIFSNLAFFPINCCEFYHCNFFPVWPTELLWAVQSWDSTGLMKRISVDVYYFSMNTAAFLNTYALWHWIQSTHRCSPELLWFSWMFMGLVVTYQFLTSKAPHSIRYLKIETSCLIVQTMLSLCLQKFKNLTWNNFH